MLLIAESNIKAANDTSFVLFANNFILKP